MRGTKKDTLKVSNNILKHWKWIKSLGVNICLKTGKITSKFAGYDIPDYSTNYKYIKLGKENFLESFNYQSYCKENLKNAIGFCEIFKQDFNLNDFCWLECEISDREMIKKMLVFRI